MMAALSQGASLLAAALWAQTADGGHWTDDLLKGGPFAIVLLLIIMDKIGTHGERDRLRAENESLRAEIRELNLTVRSEIVPPLVEVTKLTSRLLERTEPKRSDP